MKPKAPNTMTETLRQAIRKSGLPMLTLATETGIERASLIRFARGDQSLRLDVADKLAVYFGLRLVAEKTSTPKAK
jgi:plasmid maintenance system antidote protein VapI